MYSLTHGHLNSKAAQPLPSLLLAQCKLFMARNSQTGGLGEKDKNDLKKKKKEGGVCINCNLKRKSMAEPSQSYSSLL